MIRKIAITGPESTGKSLLTVQLAHHFKTSYVPEFARTYLVDMEAKYQKDDVIKIAKGQIESEIHGLETATNYLFCDTELVNIKIWLEHKYGECPKWIIDEIRNNPYDLYLLTDIDIPWAADPLREHPDKRSFFFKKFKEELEEIDANYHIISGTGNERLDKAIHAVNSLLPKHL